MDKLLSVIVPSYNMETYLAKNISSMMVQDEALRQLLEVIVVNDGSKDRTSEIAHDFATKYPGCVTVIDKPNGHYGSCINAALPVAKGKYIRILDADDYANTNAFERFIVYLIEVDREDDKLDLVISNHCKVTPEGVIFWRENYNLPNGRSFTLNSIADNFDGFVCLLAITYRTEMLREMGYRQTEGCSYSDIEWFILPMSRVRSVRYFDEVVMCYLVGRDGQTMQPEIYLRDFPIVMRLKMGVLRCIKNMEAQISIQSNVYQRQLLKRTISAVYRFVVMSRKGYVHYLRLRLFDDDVKCIDPILHKTLEQEYVRIMGARVYYIKYWRFNSFVNRIRIQLSIVAQAIEYHCSRITKS